MIDTEYIIIWWNNWLFEIFKCGLYCPKLAGVAPGWQKTELKHCPLLGRCLQKENMRSQYGSDVSAIHLSFDTVAIHPGLLNNIT